VFEADPWEYILIDHAMAILDAGLGEPPHTPPGCTKLLLSCCAKIRYSVISKVLVKHRDTFNKCMRFLMAPRTLEATHALIEDL
jgi:hypothetical protein